MLKMASSSESIPVPSATNASPVFPASPGQAGFSWNGRASPDAGTRTHGPAIGVIEPGVEDQVGMIPVPA